MLNFLLAPFCCICFSTENYYLRIIDVILPFNFQNIRATLKSLCVKYNIWAYSESVSTDFFPKYWSNFPVSVNIS